MHVTQPLQPHPQSEADWLRKYDPAKFADDHPSVAVDIVMMAVRSGSIRIPLIRRTEHPDYGAWVLPGGFVTKTERVDVAATRVLRKKLRIRKVPLHGFAFFDSPDRDKRHRVISLAHIGRIQYEQLPPQDGLLRLEAEVDGHKLRDTLGAAVNLGFDHDAILASALDAARAAAKTDLLWPLPMISADDVFTVPDLDEARRALGIDMTPDALRRKVGNDPRVIPSETTLSRGTGRRRPDGYTVVR